MLRWRNTAGIVLLAILAYLAFLIGKTFETTLTIFAIMVWTAVALVAAYMIVFRGMKFTLFKEQEESTVPGSIEGETFESGESARDVHRIVDEEAAPQGETALPSDRRDA